MTTNSPLSLRSLGLLTLALAATGGPVLADPSSPCQKAASVTAQRYWLHGALPHCNKAGCVADNIGGTNEANASLAEGQVLDRTYATVLCLNRVEPNVGTTHGRAEWATTDVLSDLPARR